MKEKVHLGSCTKAESKFSSEIRSISEHHFFSELIACSKNIET